MSACDPNRRCRYGSCPQCDYSREFEAHQRALTAKESLRAAIRLEMLREARKRALEDLRPWTCVHGLSSVIARAFDRLIAEEEAKP